MNKSFLDCKDPTLKKLLTQVCSKPKDFEIRLIAADRAMELELFDLEECLRWMYIGKKNPVGTKKHGWNWWRNMTIWTCNLPIREETLLQEKLIFARSFSDTFANHKAAYYQLWLDWEEAKNWGWILDPVKLLPK